MDLAYVVASVTLAALFVVAGIAKLADRAGAAEAMRTFGAPAALAGPLAVLLPIAELAVAGLLLFPATSGAGGIGAVALLGVFIAALGVQIGRGQRPMCRCFGQLHAAPVGWHTIARNAALAAAAGFIVVRARVAYPPSAAQLISRLSEGRGMIVLVAVVAAAVIGVQGWLLFHLLRQQGRASLRIDVVEGALRGIGMLAPDAPAQAAGLRIGTRAPAFELPNLTGRRVSLSGLLGEGRPVVLIFSDPGCRPCAELLPELGAWARRFADAASLVLMTRAVTKVYRKSITEAGVPVALAQHDNEVADAFGAIATPSAVLVLRDGTIGSQLAMGAEAIRALLARVAAPAPSAESGAGDSPAPRRGAPVGTAMPSFRLQDVEGRTVDSSALTGRSHLLVFWNPDCGYCTQMLPELRAWERDADGTPALVVISIGTVQANRALGLEGLVLRDPGFTVAPTVGVSGTPSAALFDAEGKLVAPVAVGAPNIFSMVAAAMPSGGAMAEAGGVA